MNCIVTNKCEHRRLIISLFSILSFFLAFLVLLFSSPSYSGQFVIKKYIAGKNIENIRSKNFQKNKIVKIKAGQTLNKRLKSSDRKLSDGSPFDKYSYYTKKGKTIIIDMTSEEIDSYIFLYKKARKRLKYLAEDDDSGGRGNAFLTYTLPKKGTYFIYANSIGINTFGKYSISLKKAGSGSGDISGNILVPDFNAVNETEPNNDISSAQKIKALPVKIFGEAADSDKGTDFNLGNLNTITVHDFFQIDTSFPISITLSSSFTSADFDLYLFDSFGQIIGASDNAGSSEEISYEPCNSFSFPCSSAVTYTVFVGVSAYSGTGSYELNVDYINYAQNIEQNEDKSSLNSADFVPGEAIVKFKDSPQDNDIEKRYRVLIPDESKVKLIELNIPSPPGNLRTSSLKDYKKTQTLLKINELKKDNNVIYAEPNYIYNALTVPDDELYPRQWHYKAINMPEAWDITTGNDNIIIAVIDTGISTQHPDIKDRLITGKGYDFISDPANAGDGDGMDSNPKDPGDGSNSTPSSFHGTHVAGTVAASTDNSIGVAGINWKGKIMALRTLGKKGGTSYDIAQAILYAARLPNASGKLPDIKADVINMSLGGPGFSQTMDQAVQDAISEGVTVVAAAGNESTSSPSYPASYDNVISVSAVDYNLKLSYYSNYGNSITVAAPGGDTRADNNNDGYPDGVLSAIDDDNGNKGYKYYQGTSMAAPHVAGVAALIQASRLDKGLSKLTPAQVADILTSTATDLGATGRDNSYGYGLINAAKAVKKAIEEAGEHGGTSPALSLSANEIKFGTENNSAKFTVSNTGDAGLTLSSITNSENWLTITSTNVITQSLAPGESALYNVTVSRNGLEDGKYSDSIEISSDGGSGTIAVTIQVGTASNERDIGKLFILAVNSTTFNTEDEAQTDFSENYSFNLNSLPEGSYYIVAGTDRDNDFIICDEGEACGFYPTSDQPIVIQLNNGDSLTGINFIIEEDLSFQAKGAFKKDFKLIDKQ